MCWKRISPALLFGVILAGLALSADDAANTTKKTGAVVGVLIDKRPAGGGLLVKADGEESPRRYWRFGNRPAVNKQIEAVPIGSRVRLTWETPGNEGPHVAGIEVLKVFDNAALTGAAGGTSSLDETLNWLKRVDGELKKPRYADLGIDQLKSMTDLQLGGHRKSDSKHLFVNPMEFRHLAPLSGLRKLHLGENDGVTDEALVYVGKLTGLRELILWDAPLTDAGVKHLVPLKELTNLDLAFATKVTTAALTDIAQLPKLQKLNLAGTKVKDVSPLSTLSELKELRLGKLMPAGIDKLKAANPLLVVK